MRRSSSSCLSRLILSLVQGRSSRTSNAPSDTSRTSFIWRTSVSLHLVRSTRRPYVLSPLNIPGWDDVDLVTPISSSFGLLIYLENDANADAFGKALFGTGRTSSSVYHVTVSTGVAGGYVHAKKPIYRANGYAGEIDNIIIDSSGPIYPVLNVGSHEGLESGTVL